MVAQRFAGRCRRDDAGVISSACRRDRLSLMTIQTRNTACRERTRERSRQRWFEILIERDLWMLLVNMHDALMINRIIAQRADEACYIHGIESNTFLSRRVAVLQ